MMTFTAWAVVLLAPKLTVPLIAVKSAAPAVPSALFTLSVTPDCTGLLKVTVKAIGLIASVWLTAAGAKFTTALSSSLIVAVCEDGAPSVTTACCAGVPPVSVPRLTLIVSGPLRALD